ncbi:hypothetical protein BDW59DRAFT_172595 [Aspergillus cavernicola]|uniref:Zn(2)-C6 fungal-type domain-containing protein n=1 Tax=Aspergillus cavernicola TaxID=176166 RepID=A0ABR4IAX7_9EURO
MPRPKVRPENRQRACHACLACKASKIRCDARQPCNSCVRRGQPDFCTFSGTDRRRRGQGHPSSTLVSSEEAPAQVHDTAGTPLSDLPRTPAMGHDTRSNSSNSHGSLNTGLFCVKETSSLLFLQFLRRTLKAYVGSVPFTDEELHHITIEHDSSTETADIQEVPPEELYALLDSYFEATIGILDLFTADEIDILIAQRSPEKDAIYPPPNCNDMAALDLALAIGAQARGSGDDLKLSTAYLHRARNIAFDDLLMSQSLNKVRLFVLLSFYMLGACNRNAASMFLGVAAKATVILGLHNSFEDDDSEEDGIGTSVRNLDILSSFILGKPKNLPTIRLGVVEVKIAREERNRYSSSMFTTITNACDLLEGIVDTMVKNNNILHVPTAQSLLRQLPQWSRALPLNIQQLWSTFQQHGHDLRDSDRQSLMGILHISCVYYFTAILITRPFMVAYLMSRLRGKAPDHLINDPDQASDINLKNNEVSRLGQVCVSSAIYMVDTCINARDVGFRFRNFCLLEAWVFGAGLILGFAQFAGEPRKDINDSFDHACAILADIAPISPQAQLYHKILCSFTQAVQRYKQRVADAAHQAVHQYIDRIFTLGPVPPEPDRHNNLDEHCIGETLMDPFYTQDDSGSTTMDTQHELEVDMAMGDDSFQDFEQLFYTIG